MPKYRLKTVIEYDVTAESPEELVRLAYDGEISYNKRGVDEVDAYVEAVYAEDGITKVWPKKG